MNTKNIKLAVQGLVFPSALLSVVVCMFFSKLALSGTLNINNGGRVLGTGTLVSDVVVNTGGVIEPGQSPGCLTTNNLSFAGGSLYAELGGSIACSGYDQIQVNGTVTLGASLTLSQYTGFIPSGGDTFTLIANDGGESINGSFSGLPEGSITTFAGKNLRISYLGGDGNDVVLTVLRDQVINFTALSNMTYGDASTSLLATTSSGLAVSYVTTTPSNCSVVGASVTPLAAGNCSITAAQGGNSNYNAAINVVQSFTIDKASQAISFSAFSDKTLADADFSLLASSSSGLAVSFSTATPSVCSLAGNTVSLLATGLCSLVASQVGDNNHNAAANISRDFNVTKAAQVISFATLADKTLGDTEVILAASSSSGLAVAYSTSTPAVCSVSGNSISLLNYGVCSVTASQTGNAIYLAASNVTHSFTLHDIDTDRDGIANNLDPDDDNDGVDDIFDDFPLDETETTDTDGDGIGNNADNDDDNDGVEDIDDAFPLDDSETTDSDGDGIGDNSDPTPFPQAGTIGFDSTDFRVMENAGFIDITIIRSQGDHGQLSVDFSLGDDSATADNDYEFASGTLTFADGEVARTISVNIIDDDIYEGEERFFVHLNNLRGKGALAAIKTISVFIEEDEAAPAAGVISFELVEQTISEGDSNLLVDVIRSQGSFGEVVVSYNTLDGATQTSQSAVAGEDYQAVSGELFFPDGVTRQSIEVKLLDDDIYESEEFFTIELLNPSGEAKLAQTSVIINILDDETIPDTGSVAFEQSSYLADESKGTFSINLVRLAGSYGEMSVDVETLDASAIANEDYQPLSQTIVFADGETIKSLAIKLIDDDIYEGEQEFLIQFTNPVNVELAADYVTKVVIVEDEEIPPGGIIGFSGSSYTVEENSNSLSIAITRAYGSKGIASVDIKSLSLTALNDVDYQGINQTIVLQQEEVSQSIDIKLWDDYDYEGNETFILELSNAQGAILQQNQSTSTVTIVDNEQAHLQGVVQFTGSSFTVNEALGSISLSVLRTQGSSGELSVDFHCRNISAVNGEDYILVDGNLSFADGETTKTIVIDIIDDELSESNESFQLSLSAQDASIVGNHSTASIVITDNEQAVNSVDVDSNSSTSGGTINFGYLLTLLCLLYIRYFNYFRARVSRNRK